MCRKYLNNHNSQTWWFSLLNLRTKGFEDMGSLCWSGGSILGKQGIEVEKEGWDLLGMCEKWKTVINNYLSCQWLPLFGLAYRTYCVPSRILHKIIFLEGILLAIPLKSFQVHQQFHFCKFILQICTIEQRYNLGTSVPIPF